MNTIIFYREMNFFEVIHKLHHFLYALRLLYLNVEANVLGILILKDNLLAVVITYFLGDGLHLDVIKLEYFAVDGQSVGLDDFLNRSRNRHFRTALLWLSLFLWGRVEVDGSESDEANAHYDSCNHGCA